MSDDGSMSASRADGHDAAAAAAAAQRKGPRFTWTPAYEATFFRSLCDSVRLGLKDNHSFKQEAWDRAMQTLQDRHNAYPNKSHLINKSDNARKKFRLWRGLVEHPDFLYNPATKVVTGSDEAWREHVEKEPLSRSLKGRPFEHEEYYEILFPDVIGSGGAPKRITKQRRKGPDAIPGAADEADTPGTAILDLLNSGQAAPPQLQQLQLQSTGGGLPTPRAASTRASRAAGAAATATATAMTAAPANATQQQQRPTSTAIPPRGAIASTAALTPPDEEAPTARKRMSHAHADPAHPHAEKRRRAAAAAAATTTHQHPNTYVDLTLAAQQQQQQQSQAQQQAPQQSSQISPSQQPQLPLRSQHSSSSTTTEAAAAALLADALARHHQPPPPPPPPRWPEQAMEIFFRDFADEDMDLQVKIAEKMLTDANKAAMFCKMPVQLRQHWIKRLREAHSRGLAN